MNGTPRLRSAFPGTPQTARQQDGTPARGPRLAQALPDISILEPLQNHDGPLIPFETLDAPQQRLYVVAFYVALLAWRLYDHHHLQEEETESLWLFMKWVAFDGIFLFGLPELRIPWLEWSSATMTILFLGHAILDGILMFRIPIPIGAGLAAFAKLFYDRELAISERHVKHSTIVHNSSLILGKQIIHILPEGSAILNPSKKSFCLDGSHSQAHLPIQINQTTPIGIDLLRLDLDGVHNETIHITPSQLKKMSKEAIKSDPNHAENQPLLLRFPVRKTGMYVLQKVIDESKLEVQRRRAGDTFVVTCPRAAVKPSPSNKCKGDLSDIELEVTGTPPLRLKFHKTSGNTTQDAQFQSIQPEDFVSPMTQQPSDALVPSNNNKNITWARQMTISIPLSEQLKNSGTWVIALEEVEDAFGNAVAYSKREHEEQEAYRARTPHLHQVINVHERPTARMQGCNSQRPLKVARDHQISLPVEYGTTGKGGFLDPPYTLEYLFTPDSDLLQNGDHSGAVQTKQVIIKNPRQKPSVHLSGLYSLNAVKTEFCAGEILEPASCLLQNPSVPSLRIETEEIFDKCANKPIGLRADLHLTGSPPFNVQYRMTRRGENHFTTHSEKVSGLRGQITLTPQSAGHYTYEFGEISDDIYKGYKLSGSDLVIEQDVKPSASARFVEASPKRRVCIDQPVSFDIRLRGEGPFTIDYEVVRGNDRKRFTVNDIASNQYTIQTKPFSKGGEYTLALASVTDKIGCKEFLKEEAKIDVRHQRPKAGFGHIEGARSAKTLQGDKIQLPLRLTGEAPWTVCYQNVRQPGKEYTIHVAQPNGEFSTQEEGTYELTSVNDAICPGAVDETANKFDVSWVARPQLIIPDSSFTNQDYAGKYLKQDVCEGEEDAIDVHFRGSPPFEVRYQEHIKPEQGSKALRNKALSAALGVSSIQMDTSKAGLVEYVFTELGDSSYEHDSKHFKPITVQQRVNPRPSARFTSPGKTYSYCSVESNGEEVIPITLTGVPPFSIDVEIKHHGSARPESFSIPNIQKTTYDLKVPHKSLHLGNSAVSIRKITDSRGCSRILDSGSPRVQISVHDAPSIKPLENQEDFCVGDRISFALSGQAPFTVHYDFNGVSRKATSGSTTFKRLAEKPGVFQITAVSDSGSSCRANTHIKKIIHGMPSVQVSKGRESIVDIHEGGEAEITFDFGGTPPFEFTWTRSTNVRRGQRSEVLEMRSEVCNEHSMNIRANEEGTYEVVSIKDRYCAYAKEGVDLSKKKGKLLTY